MGDKLKDLKLNFIIKISWILTTVIKQILIKVGEEERKKRQIYSLIINWRKSKYFNQSF